MLKEDGRAGLLYAVDNSGKFISAVNAVNGEKYNCPVCGCMMHILTTKTGKRIFARNPGAQHTNGRCISYESKSNKHSFDNLEPEKFIEGLCRVVPKKKEPDSNDAKKAVGTILDTNGAEDDIKISPFSSLRQIAEEIDFLDGSVPQGDHIITDFVLTYKSASKFFSEKNRDLGARIVYCRFNAPENKSNTLLFDLFSINKGIYVRFCLIFSDKKRFVEYRDKFGRFGELENGSTGFIRKHNIQDVLIACDNWELIDRQYCKNNCRKDKCGDCYGMYQAIFTNPKQIYLIPADY